jgi:hypothetical protein
MEVESTMSKVYKLVTTVRPGHRVEVTTPEVEVGRRVEVTVVEEQLPVPIRGRAFLHSLPRIQHTPEEWSEIDRQFQEERDAWER